MPFRREKRAETIESESERSVGPGTSSEEDILARADTKGLVRPLEPDAELELARSPPLALPSPELLLLVNCLLLGCMLSTSIAKAGFSAAPMNIESASATVKSGAIIRLELAFGPANARETKGLATLDP